MNNTLNDKPCYLCNEGIIKETIGDYDIKLWDDYVFTFKNIKYLKCTHCNNKIFDNQLSQRFLHISGILCQEVSQFMKEDEQLVTKNNSIKENNEKLEKCNN